MSLSFSSSYIFVMVWIRKWWGEVFEVLYKIFLQQELHCGSAWREAEQDLDRGLNFLTFEQKAEAEHSNHSFFHLHQKFYRWTWHSDSKAWQPAQCQFPTWGWWCGKVKSRLAKTGDCFPFCFSYQIVFLSLHFSEEISNIRWGGAERAWRKWRSRWTSSVPPSPSSPPQLTRLPALTSAWCCHRTTIGFGAKATV